MNGVDLFRVQALMGDKSSRMTIRYAHLSPEHLRAAVATLDAPGPKPWASRPATSGANNEGGAMMESFPPSGQQLKGAAGFAFVPVPLPMKNGKNGVVYYLFFPSK
jgi:hypothetical protein